MPDHTVLNRFHSELVRRGLLEKLFNELDLQLEKAGAVLKRGTMLDATLIEAVSRPGTGERVRIWPRPTLRCPLKSSSPSQSQ